MIMLKQITLATLALSLGLAAPVAAFAAETPAKPALTQDVEAQLKALKKAVGAGEMSAKQYKVRKEALLSGSSQTAKSDGK
jgi:hypothetical protein